MQILEGIQFMHCKILGLPVQEGTGRKGCNMGPDSYRA
ncbi:arginase, partial [Brucella abortus]